MNEDKVGHIQSSCNVFATDHAQERCKVQEMLADGHRMVMVLELAEWWPASNVDLRDSCRRTCQAPAPLGLQCAACLGSQSALVTDYVCFIKDDPAADQVIAVRMKLAVRQRAIILGDIDVHIQCKLNDLQHPYSAKLCVTGES